MIPTQTAASAQNVQRLSERIMLDGRLGYLWLFDGTAAGAYRDIITQHGGWPMTVFVAPPQTIWFSLEW